MTDPTSPQPDDNPVSRWLRRRRARPLVIAYLLIGLVGALALRGVQNEAADRRFDLCVQFNNQQAVIRELIEVVTQPGAAETSSLSSLPEFRRLDPDTQAWVFAIEAQSRTAVDNPDGEPDTLAERLIEFAKRRLTPADC